MNDNKRLEKLVRQVQKTYGFPESLAGYHAENLLQKLPKQLLVNVDEWCAGEELTDVCVGKYSIPMILKIWNDSSDFLAAANALIEYVANPDRGERMIWRTRR